MIVYIVTEGQYDDYHVEAVFSNLTDAKAFVNKGELAEPSILEWPVDSPDKDPRTVAQWFYIRSRRELTCREGAP